MYFLFPFSFHFILHTFPSIPTHLHHSFPFQEIITMMCGTLGTLDVFVGLQFAALPFLSEDWYLFYSMVS